MNKVLPIHEYLMEEDVIFPASQRIYIIANLCELYDQTFSMELVEHCFLFPETVVGDDWELWYVDDEGEMYGILPTALKKGQKEVETDYLLPLPLTLADFIHDCKRVWKKDLVWDGNLIKRNFKVTL